MSARLLGEPFDPWRELADFQASLAAGKSGACCSFTGTMRDFNAGDSVDSMRLDHYPDMTQRFLNTICDEARGRWEFSCRRARHGTALRESRPETADPFRPYL